MIYTLTLNPALDRELRVPAIVLGEVLRATSSSVDWGGKGFNVSRALRALGAESVALGFVGGFAGRLIAAGLQQLGIAVDFVEIAGETRTNVTVVDGAQHLKVNESGPHVTAADEALLVEKIRGLARPDDWWILSGSLPPGASPRFYADVIELVQSAGARALLDTSGEPLRHGCGAAPLLVKPNAAEAAELVGRPVVTLDDAHRAARDLRELGAASALVSLGKSGAVLATGASAWVARPPIVAERNAVGAGDAMLAGLVWALARGEPTERALRWAVASGAAAAALDGTAVGDHAIVAQLERTVEVTALAPT